MSLKHSLTLSPWPVLQVWLVFKPNGKLVHVRHAPVPPPAYRSLTVWTTLSWFVWVRPLCFGDQHLPLVVHVACPGGVREIR